MVLRRVVGTMVDVGMREYIIIVIVHECGDSLPYTHYIRYTHSYVIWGIIFNKFVSNYDKLLLSKFWKELHHLLNIKIKLSIVYHSEIICIIKSLMLAINDPRVWGVRSPAQLYFSFLGHEGNLATSLEGPDESASLNYVHAV